MVKLDGVLYFFNFARLLLNQQFCWYTIFTHTVEFGDKFYVTIFVIYLINNIFQNNIKSELGSSIFPINEKIDFQLLWAATRSVLQLGRRKTYHWFGVELSVRISKNLIFTRPHTSMVYPTTHHIRSSSLVHHNIFTPSHSTWSIEFLFLAIFLSLFFSGRGEGGVGGGKK